MTGPSGGITIAGFLLLFAGALVGIVRWRSWFARLPLAVLAFVAAAACGVSFVNAYYGYYDSWSALAADLSADNGPPAAPVVFAHNQPPATPLHTPTANPVLGPWTVRKVSLPGPVSGVRRRTALVVLPPGYDSSSALPVIELLHGEPGDPTSWTNGLHLARVLQRLAEAGRIGREVVVLPDVQGRRGQQCLDDPRGVRLTTWLTTDVPQDLTAALHVAAPGAQWVLGGLSEGAYCAATVGLSHPHTWGGIGLMDGYFHPDLTKAQLERYFHGSRTESQRADPTSLLEGSVGGLPHFWIMSGTKNAQDYRRAVEFGNKVAAREAFRFVSVIGGRHTTPAWRTALPDLLTWSWTQVQGRAAAGDLQLPLS